MPGIRVGQADVSGSGQLDGLLGEQRIEQLTLVRKPSIGGADADINSIDVYAQGESEQIVGKALKSRRDDIIVATKFHGAMGDDPNGQGSSRRWIVKAGEGSLRRLDTDWIDLYQVHRPLTAASWSA